MSIPFVKNFAYDLWKTKDGRCWARVRATGQVTEISKEVMQDLRREEKAIWRYEQECDEDAGEQEQQTYEISHPLSLDVQNETLEQSTPPSWAISHDNIEVEALSLVIEHQLLEILTERERAFYQYCIIEGKSKKMFANKYGISVRRTSAIFVQIKRKLKKLLDDYS